MTAHASDGCLYLVDAFSLIFQVFHAIPDMSSPSGLPTNALYGFTRDLLYLRTDKHPNYLICAFDEPGPTFRDAIFPEYKAHRPPAPDDLVAQIPLIRTLLQAMRVPVLGLSGFEADDIIATVSRSAEKRNIDVYVCTNDKDCRQLISDRIRLFNLRKHTILDREGLLADWGIKPEQVVDLQSLVGDSVDNVPGVPGIGLKTAAKLLQEYGTLENVLANIDKVPGAKKQENLRASREQLKTGEKLVRLATDVPIAMDWDNWQLQPWDAPKLLALFKEWGFRGFADQVRREAASSSTQGTVASLRMPEENSAAQEVVSKSNAATNAPKDLFSDLEDAAQESPNPAATNVQSNSADHDYQLVDTPEKFDAFYEKLAMQNRFAIDLETTNVNPVQAQIVGMSFSWQTGKAWYLAFRAPQGESVLSWKEMLPWLARVLEDPRVAKVNQNIKYDLIALRANGIALQGVEGDSMVADYLLHAGERSHSIADQALRYFNHRVTPISDLIGKGKNQIVMDQVPAARVAEYSGEDADFAYRLCELLEPKVNEIGLGKLYQKLEVPLIEVLAEMEFNGIRLDIPLLKRLSKEMAKQLAVIECEIYDLAGHDFNIASPKQLRQVLFEEMKLPTQRRTGTTGEASTDQETLERLAALGHGLPRKIVEHRQVSKLKGTYVDVLPELVNPATGRIHASFNQTVATTGRLSSSDPNLQNIPVRTEQGRQIRQAFLPAEGWSLLTADYSQIELRLLAHFCGDTEMRRAFAEDRDVHTSVAAQIFGVAEADVAADMRRMAKTVNFGIIYGMSAHGLSQRLGIPRDEAARFIEAYFARFPKVLSYQTQLLEKARKNQYVSTMLGRRREITGIRPDSTYQQRNQPEREAVNMEIQGSAADLIKMAMLNIYRRLRKDKFEARLLLQIHDELVFEAPPGELEALGSLVVSEMTTPLEKELGIDVPLKVDMGTGPNWLDVEDMTVASSA